MPKCLICGREAPTDRPKESMRGMHYRQRDWYCNNLTNVRTGQVVEWYLCPDHCEEKYQLRGWEHGRLSMKAESRRS
jgi:hypothetical protein